MTDKLSGSCLCGKMVFELEDAFDEFHLCHCQQCQKASGSAHVAHLFTRADNINWLQGQEHLAQYDVPNRAISNAFCQSCGSPMPYVSLASGKLVVPAGALPHWPRKIIFFMTKRLIGMRGVWAHLDLNYFLNKKSLAFARPF